MPLVARRRRLFRLTAEAHAIVAGEGIAAAIELGGIGRAGEDPSDEAVEADDVEEERIIDNAAEEADAAGQVLGHDRGVGRVVEGGVGAGRREDDGRGGAIIEDGDRSRLRGQRGGPGRERDRDGAIGDRVAGELEIDAVGDVRIEDAEIDGLRGDDEAAGGHGDHDASKIVRVDEGVDVSDVGGLVVGRRGGVAMIRGAEPIGEEGNGGERGTAKARKRSAIHMQLVLGMFLVLDAGNVRRWPGVGILGANICRGTNSLWQRTKGLALPGELRFSPLHEAHRSRCLRPWRVFLEFLRPG